MSRPRSCASTMERRLRVCSSSGGMRESPGVRRRLDAEMLERPRRQVGDAPQRRDESDGEEWHLGIGGRYGAVTPTAEMAPATKIVELDAFGGRGELLAGVRISERRPRTLERVRMGQARHGAARLPATRRQGNA